MAVTALEIHARSTVLDGRAFGRAGAYETLAGIIRFAVDPRLAVHAPIADIALAPTNASGLVESWADFYLLRPVDPAAGNRRLLLDVPNRGRKIALGLFNSAVRVSDPRAAEDFGNGFLMRHGYTVAWVGWQPDVPRRDGLMALSVPSAADGARPISGLVRCEFRPNDTVDVLPLADRYHIPNPVARLDDPLHLADERVVQEGLVDEERPARGPRGLHELAAVGRRERERLLHPDVLPGAERGQRHRVVAGRRRRDDDRVEVHAREHRREIGARAGVRVVLLRGLEELRIEVADLGDARARHPTERPEQVLAPVARAHDPDL